MTLTAQPMLMNNQGCDSKAQQMSGTLHANLEHSPLRLIFPYWLNAPIEWTLSWLILEFSVLTLKAQMTQYWARVTSFFNQSGSVNVLPATAAALAGG